MGSRSPAGAVPSVLVVAALVQDEQGRVLLSQRRADQAMPLLWELPGGKVERGETPMAALGRELKEELGVRVEVGQLVELVDYRYGHLQLLMLVYRAQLAEGTPRPVEVNDVRFVPAGELSQYAFPPADAPIVARLMAAAQT